MNKILTRSMIVVAAALSVAPALAFNGKYNAVILSGSALNGQNNAAGNITQIKTSNAVDGSDFAFYATFSKNNGQIANGYWLVVSPGPNPKGNSNELAIFYLDASKSTPKLTAYQYNGVNGDTSFRDGNGDGTSGDAKKLVASTDVSWLKEVVVKDNANGTKTLGFRVNPAKVNSGPSGYTGSSYGSKLGIWFHPVSGLTTNYGSDGYLKQDSTGFKYACEGWFDSSDIATTCTNNPVPEPASALALGLGLAVLRKRRS